MFEQIKDKEIREEARQWDECSRKAFHRITSSPGGIKSSIQDSFRSFFSDFGVEDKVRRLYDKIKDTLSTGLQKAPWSNSIRPKPKKVVVMMKMDTADLEEIVNDGYSSPSKTEEQPHKAESQTIPPAPQEHSHIPPPIPTERKESSPAKSETNELPLAPGIPLEKEDLSEEDLEQINKEREMIRKAYPDIPPAPPGTKYVTEKINDAWSDGIVDEWDKQFTEISKNKK